MRSESSVKFYIYIWPCAIIGLIMLFPSNDMAFEFRGWRSAKTVTLSCHR
jgi:hypothetical protein